MKLSTKSRYAVLAMLDLAYYGQKELPTSLSEISNRQDISLSYLEQLFSMLKKNNLVGSLKGPGGGYFLAKDSNTIYISEIIDAVEEKMETTSCNGKANCNNSRDSSFSNVNLEWQAALFHNKYLRCTGFRNSGFFNSCLMIFIASSNS